MSFYHVTDVWNTGSLTKQRIFRSQRNWYIPNNVHFRRCWNIMISRNVPSILCFEILLPRIPYFILCPVFPDRLTYWKKRKGDEVTVSTTRSDTFFCNFPISKKKKNAKIFVFSLSISVEWDYPVVWDNVWTLVNRENRRHHDLNQTNSLIALAIVFFIVTFVKLISLLVVSMRIIHYHCLSM